MSRRSMQALCAGSLVAAVAAIGCSSRSAAEKTYPVSGEVFYEGKPAAGAAVIFHPIEAGKESQRARGRVEKDGTFRLSTRVANDGASAGNYIVTVEWKKTDDHPEQGISLLADRYADPKTSGLTAIVKEEENRLPPFKLSRQGK
ncbi:MAG: hypothetical protein U0744_10370 [Gemmataceae bacterium]